MHQAIIKLYITIAKHIPFFLKNRTRKIITRGDIARSHKYWTKAAKHYAAALTIDPMLIDIWVQYGHALKEQGRLHEAEEAYRRSISLNGAAADTHVQLGHVLKLQNKRQEAALSYLESYRLKPNSSHIVAELEAVGAGILLDQLEFAMINSQSRQRVISISRLYVIIYGRPPDRGGLQSFARQLQNGKKIRDVALEFIESEEFCLKLNGVSVREKILSNVFGCNPIQDFSQHETNEDLVIHLMDFLDSQKRFDILSYLYPEGVPLDNPDAYRVWLSEYSMDRSIKQLPSLERSSSVLFSFIMILEKPNEAWLEAAISTFSQQSSSYVELIIMTRRNFPPIVTLCARTDTRIRLVKVTFLYRAAALFNHALALCNGEFIGLIGQHDQLNKAAAVELAALTEVADIIVSDEDALDHGNLRHSPKLGTAWDADRVIASGCPGLILIRTALLRDIGGMRRSAGREEWDLLLRAAAAVSEARIAHVSSILLSRREGGNPQGMHHRHQITACLYLSTMGHKATVQREQGVLRVVYPLPSRAPTASIIIPTRDRADLVRTCVNGLLQRTAYPALEIVIVDNGSTEPDAMALLRELSNDRRIRIVNHAGPFNWSALNNVGCRHMCGEIVVLLNNDTDVIEPNWLGELVSQSLRPEVGIVGAKLLYPNWTVQHAGVVLGPAGQARHMWRHAPADDRGYLNQLISTRRVTAMTGACLALRREIYDAVGGCNEDLAITWNDVDLCLRVRAQGLRAIWTPYARLLHLEQATRGSDDVPERQARYNKERDLMRARWNGLIDSDPFLNPALLPNETWPQPHLAVKSSANNAI
jgi:GT2 family glycosyltransferase/tetratricopeptide (TPR) repeat protein